MTPEWRRVLRGLVIVITWPVLAAAQAPAVSWRVEFVAPGTTTPVLGSATFSNPICGLTPAPADPDPLVNPTIVEFDDENATGKVCQKALPATLAALPDGQYEALVTALSATGLASAPARSLGPFVRRRSDEAPRIPTGVRVRK